MKPLSITDEPKRPVNQRN